ncbi:hypothetical protein UPYG_G00091590 [Umbra pygmaea]|uniref:Uncharacterized protein n=1 Tax=Umbra pygmaea TaxID=75934 RepID=A0ABD0XJ82_UMBPY
MVTQSDAALKCFTCDKGLRLDSIVNSVTDDPLWERSPVVSHLLECSITSPPPAGKCVPCVNHEKVYIVSVDLPVDWKLDLEDSEGNYLSYTEASE